MTRINIAVDQAKKTEVKSYSRKEIIHLQHPLRIVSGVVFGWMGDALIDILSAPECFNFASEQGIVYTVEKDHTQIENYRGVFPWKGRLEQRLLRIELLSQPAISRMQQVVKIFGLLQLYQCQLALIANVERETLGRYLKKNPLDWRK